MKIQTISYFHWTVWNRNRSSAQDNTPPMYKIIFHHCLSSFSMYFPCIAFESKSFHALATGQRNLTFPYFTLGWIIWRKWRTFKRSQCWNVGLHSSLARNLMDNRWPHFCVRPNRRDPIIILPICARKTLNYVWSHCAGIIETMYLYKDKIWWKIIKYKLIWACYETIF